MFTTNRSNLQLMAKFDQTLKTSHLHFHMFAETSGILRRPKHPQFQPNSLVTASSISKFSQIANSPDKNIWLKVRTPLSRGKCLSGIQNSKTCNMRHSKWDISIHKLVIEQAAKKGFQLKADRVDFEAKWQHLAPKAAPPPIQTPTIHQPAVFSFLQGGKLTNEKSALSTQSYHYGDEEFYTHLSQYGLEWLRDSAYTYENINLSAHMMRLAVQNGIGFRTENQEIRTKHAQLFQEYTASGHLKAIEQLFVVFQIATLSSLHQFPFGFCIWAPKIMQPPLVYVGSQRPCLIFLILSQEPDQPFKFGTVAFDYRQDRDYLAHTRISRICADVVQLSYQSFVTFPITVRVNEGIQYIHLSEFATLQSPICSLCYLHSLGAAPCFLHQVTPSDAVMHLVGGMDGTGGLIILGTIAADYKVTLETVKWIVIHILDNQQAQGVTGIEAFIPCQHAISICWSPIWFAQSPTHRTMPRQIGTRLIESHTVDLAGEYLISSYTEEWSRLLFARDEAPMEG